MHTGCSEHDTLSLWAAFIDLPYHRAHLPPRLQWCKKKNWSISWRRMLQEVSRKSTFAVETRGVWPSTGCLGDAGPHPERKSPFGKAVSSHSFRVCSPWSAPRFNVLPGAGWPGSRWLSLWLRRMTATGAPGCSLFVLDWSLLFLQPLFPLLGGNW